MAIQSGATVKVAFSPNDSSQATVGTSGTFTDARLTDRNGPLLEVGELTSNEVTNNRQETSIRSGFQQVTGQLGFELSYKSQDNLIELATNDDFAKDTLANSYTLTSESATDDYAWDDTTKLLTIGENDTATFDTDFADGDLVYFTFNSGAIAGYGTVNVGTVALELVLENVTFTAGDLNGGDVTATQRSGTGSVFEPYPEQVVPTGTGAYTASSRTLVNSDALPAPYAVNDTTEGQILFIDNGLAGANAIKGLFYKKSDTKEFLLLHPLGDDFDGESNVTAQTYGVSARAYAPQFSKVSANAIKYCTILKQYPEAGTAGLAQAFGGCTVSSLAFSSTPDSLVTGTVDILGVRATDLDATYNSVNPGANPGAAETAYSPFSSCVAISGIESPIVSSFEVTLANNRETLPLLCSAFASDVYEGVANVSGSMTLLFEDADEYNYFANENERAITLSLDSGASDGSGYMVIHIPRARFTQPAFEIPTNGPVVLTLNFRGLESSLNANMPEVSETSAVIYRAPITVQ